MPTPSRPPSVLDSAAVQAFASVEALQPSNRTTMYVDGVQLGKVPNLAVAQNNYDAGDFLLFYCSSEWRVLAAAGYSSAIEAFQGAERAYPGVGALWSHVV